MNIRSCVAWIGVLLINFTPPQSFGDQPIYPSGHDRAGLPVRNEPMTVYDDDIEHPLNQLHALLFLRELIPAEVQSQLPSERRSDSRTDPVYFQKGWYFEKRKGTEADRAVFGGDVRISPIRSIEELNRSRLVEILRPLSTRAQVDSIAALSDPIVRLLVQWDIMSVWWNLERAKTQDVELLEAMVHSIIALSQTEETLRSLPSGLDDLHASFDGGDSADRTRPFLPSDFPPALHDTRSPWVELGRKSSVLFQADRSLRSSFVYLNTGNRDDVPRVLETVLDKSKTPEDVQLPAPTMTGLIQTIVAIDDQLNPVVTPVIDELRIRVAQGPFELSSESNSSSRDGSSHWIYMRSRYGTTRKAQPDFRFISDKDQALFIEYGTLKHASYAAQCALCHRLTGDGGQVPLGIRTLSRHAQPHIALPEERKKIAQEEASKVANRLRERLAKPSKAGLNTQFAPEKANGKALASKVETADQSRDSSSDNAPFASDTSLKRVPPRPERSDQDRIQFIAELRASYSKPSSLWPAPHVDPGVPWKEIGVLPAVQHPADNPYSKIKEQLGKTLFFDPRLSGSGQLACASCHDPDLGWADGRTTSFGHSRKLLSRNSPSVQFSGYFSSMFWDGRAISLEDQAQQVLLNPDEMRAAEGDVAKVLEHEPEYRSMFEKAFQSNSITLDRIAKAIACFERSIDRGTTRFDAFMKGKRDALSDSELIGMDLFRREARCMNCHFGPLFSDSQFHELGLSYYGRKFEDLGRYRISGRAQDVGKFRTPSLRNVTGTTPLMHNGLFELSGVLNMYNAGMPTLRRNQDQLDDELFPNKSPHLKPLGLNKQDLADLAAFLGTLEESKRRIRPPQIPGLYPAP